MFEVASTILLVLAFVALVFGIAVLVILWFRERKLPPEEKERRRKLRSGGMSKKHFYVLLIVRLAVLGLLVGIVIVSLLQAREKYEKQFEPLEVPQGELRSEQRDTEFDADLVVEEIQIVPIGKTDPEDLNIVLGIVEASFPAVRATIASEGDLPSHAFDQGRQQYDAQILLEELEGRSGEKSIRMIGITNEDIFVPGAAFVFSHAHPNGNSTVISTLRLNDMSLHEDLQEVLRNKPREWQDAVSVFKNERYKKVLLRALGITFGFQARDKEEFFGQLPCVMVSSNSVLELEHKEAGWCDDEEEEYVAKIQRLPPQQVSEQSSQCLYGYLHEDEFLVKYTAQRGDTLLSIAKNELGDISRVHQLINLNTNWYPHLSLENPFIEVGWELRLPPTYIKSSVRELWGINQWTIQGKIVKETEEFFHIKQVVDGPGGYILEKTRDTVYLGQDSFAEGDCVIAIFHLPAKLLVISPQNPDYIRIESDDSL